MKTRHPTPGAVLGKHNPNIPRAAYVVIHDLPNGMRICGHHPRKGQVVQLSADEARHLLLGGIVELASAVAVIAAGEAPAEQDV